MLHLTPFRTLMLFAVAGLALAACSQGEASTIADGGPVRSAGSQTGTAAPDIQIVAYQGADIILDFPDRTEFPEHEALWDGANYKTAY